MASRSDRLDRLMIGYECRTSWEQMRGDGARRFCGECRREVFDFEQMLPSEIDARLRASRGAMCARLTWRDGRLVMAREPEPPGPSTCRPPRHVPALAAGLVTAWLSGGAGAGAAQGEPAAAVAAVAAPSGQAEREPAEREPPRRSMPVVTAALAGTATAEGAPLAGVTVVARNLLDGHEATAHTGDDGTFVIAPLAGGVYEVEGQRARFSIAIQRLALPAGEQRQIGLTAEPRAEVTTMGAVVATSLPLRRAYDQSDLVVEAVVGRSVVASREDDVVEVVTELHVGSFIKGGVAGREVVYRHPEYEPAAGEPGAWRSELPPGSHVLALLESGRAESGGARPAVFAAEPNFGVQVLGDGERAAYVERLEALARIERRAKRSGEVNVADLAEWLVATAEDPLTRGEATGELATALEALDDLAARAGSPPQAAADDVNGILDRFRDEGGTLRNQPDVLLGAAVTAEHERRLTAALRAAETLGKGDRELFQIVLRWDEGAARESLERLLRTAKPRAEVAEEELGWLLRLGDDLDDPAIRAVVAAAEDRRSEIESLWSADETQEAFTLRQEKLAALAQDLRRELAAALRKGKGAG